MSDHYLVVDDARRLYFDCEKFLLAGEGDPIKEHPFETWLRLANWDDDPPEKSNRYLISETDGRRLYDFLVGSQWKARIVSLDSDDYDVIFEPWVLEHGGEPTYHCAGVLYDG
jgi:hypothetical protein